MSQIDFIWKRVQKDVKFLEKMLSIAERNGLVDNLWEDLDLPEILAPYHPKTPAVFKEELQDVSK